MSEKKLKPEQEQAIQLEENLIVPANAGSGKTFVMLRRVVYNIVEKNASVLDFLLITFTDAAASQMRTKLQQELLKAFETETDYNKKMHLKKQINLLSVADISTIHTFCYKLIKKYFYALDVEASINIADEVLSKSLQEKAFQKTLDSFCVSENQEFLSLIYSYNNKRNFDSIKEIVLKLFNVFTNTLDKPGLKQKMIDVYKKGADNNVIFGVLKDWAIEIFGYWKQRFSMLYSESKLMDVKKLQSICFEILEFLNKISPNSSFEDVHKVVFSYEKFTKMQQDKTVDDDELYQKVKNEKSSLTEDLKKMKEKFLFNDLQKLKEDIEWCENNVKTLLKMEEDFENNYSNLKKQKNVLDFADLEHLAFKVLQNKEICDEVSSAYKQIFVDEYQDVNDVQEGIINSLWKNDKNTLFLVGDPKQSIYGFRNTNPQIMIDKLKLFNGEEKNSKAVPLKYNFRSDKNILNFVNYVFSRLMTQKTSQINYKQDGMFFVGLEDFKEQETFPNVEIDIVLDDSQKEKKPKPESVYSVEDAEMVEKEDLIFAKSEGQIIASKIAEMFAKKHQIFDADCKTNGGMRPVNFKDIAILFRSRSKEIDVILKELENCGIPVKKVSQDTILEEYEVQVLLNYLKLLQSFEDDYALTGFLTSPVVDMDIEEVANIPKTKDKSFAENVLESKNPKVEFAKSLVKNGREQLFNNTIFGVLNWFVETTNYKTKLFNLPNGRKKVLNANIFINSFQNNDYNNSLTDYLSFLEQNDEIKFDIENGGEQNAVSALTMHKSKGLEYPIVFVVNMAKEFNVQDSRGPCLFSKELGIGVQRFNKENHFKTSTIARSAIVVSELKRIFAEELRVLYVALTRAKNHLFLIGKTNIEKLDGELNDYIIEKKNNAFSLVLTSLSESTQKAIKAGKRELKVQTNKEQNTFFAINVFDPIQNKISNYVSKSEIKNEKYDFLEQTLANHIENIEQKLLIQRNQSKIALKNSVSRLMEKEDKKENVAPSFKKFKITENSVSPDKIGTAFHYAMEIVPFNLQTEQEVFKFLKENMDAESFALVDTNKIFKCVDYLRPWTSKASKILREAKFYLFDEHKNLVKDGIDSKILVQGIVDLVLCVDGETILIDYKTNREIDDDKMREKYQIQLECYKKAIENALKTRVSRKILYSFFKDYAIFV